LTPPLIGLTEYPRVHVLTTSQWIVSGFNTVSTRWTHDPTQDPTYQFDTGQITANYDQMVFYGTSLLYPNFGGVYNRLVRIGGQRWTVSWASYASNMVEVSYAASPGDFWASGTSGLYRMVSTRYQGNVVILPSGNLFAIGGYTDDRSPRP
jgi:hypothetical protein